MYSEMIETYSEYRMALQQMEGRARPPVLLTALMGILESYRARQRMGWSRPQNKEGVRTFKTLVPTAGAMAEIAERSYNLLHQREMKVSAENFGFVEDLLIDPKLMSFMFFHDVEEDDRNFEGVTLSFGRRTGRRNRFRDRLDVILEAEVVQGVSQGFARFRVFIDPYDGGGKRTEIIKRDALFASEEARELFIMAEEFYRVWRDVPERQWTHWTQEYVEYFGARKEPVSFSRFPTAEDATMECEASASRSWH